MSEHDATPIGTMIDNLQSLRLKKDKLDARLKETVGDIEDLRIRIRQTMDVMGLETASGKSLTVSAKDTTYGQIEDIDTFYDWIKQEDALYFLERRVSQGSFREYLKMYEGELPPGLTSYTTHDLTLRKK